MGNLDSTVSNSFVHIRTEKHKLLTVCIKNYNQQLDLLIISLFGCYHPRLKPYLSGPTHTYTIMLVNYELLPNINKINHFHAK